MRRKEKAERIQKVLEELYPLPAIPLAHEDPYTLLVAVVLSAQCTDARVNQTTPELFARASTPAAMARLPVETIQRIIRPCGLSPSKAKNIRELSRRLVDEFGSKVPRTFEELESLPGVGHKTAGVVRVQAFGLPAFPVDTHIHRLAHRWGLSSGRNVEQTEADLVKLFPEESWGRLHLQMIYFGREHCPAARHDLTQCPICSWAATRAQARREAERWRPRKTTPRRK